MAIYHLQWKDGVDPRKWAQEHGAKWYEFISTFAFVIRAASQSEARKMASSHSEPWWLSDDATTCDELSPEGAPEIIMIDAPTG